MNTYFDETPNQRLALGGHSLKDEIIERIHGQFQAICMIPENYLNSLQFHFLETVEKT